MEKSLKNSSDYYNKDPLPMPPNYNTMEGR